MKSPPSQPRKTEPAQNNIQIRQASKADVTSIAALIKELAEYEELSHAVTMTEADLLRYGFSDDPAQNVYKCLLAEQEGNVVGFALYYLTYSTFLGKPGLYLEDIFVRPAARGCGAGKQLFNALMKEIIDKDYGRFEWQVLDWNQSAIDFYDKVGANRHEGWHSYRMTHDEVCKAYAGL